MSETFTWRCPVCGHLNTQPVDGARIESLTPCCHVDTGWPDATPNDWREE